MISLSVLERELQAVQKQQPASLSSPSSTTSTLSPMSRTSMYSTLHNIDNFREQRQQDQVLLSNLRQDSIVDPIVQQYEQNRLVYDKFHMIMEEFYETFPHKQWIDFHDFQWIKQKLPTSSGNKYFTAKTFLFLGPNDEGVVYIRDFIQ